MQPLLERKLIHLKHLTWLQDPDDPYCTTADAQMKLIALILKDHLGDSSFLLEDYNLDGVI